MKHLIIAALCLAVPSTFVFADEAASADTPPSNFPWAAWDKRVPPVMPNSANRSGYCCARVVTDAAGKPSDMAVGYCTEEVFRVPTENALSQWTFKDEAADSLRETPEAHGQLMSFRLTDMADRCLPDVEGWMCNADGTFATDLSYADLCRADWIS